MKLKNTYLIALLALSAAAFTGCNSAKSGFEYSYVKEKKTNVLGVIKTQDRSFTLDDPASANLSSNELLAVHNPSGRKVDLLWGLITLKDY